MNTLLLIFFALPIAVIIVSAILEKTLKSPITVAALIFAIFLVITFAVFDENFLIATLVYTIIAFITALIVHFIKCRHENEHNTCDLLEDLLHNHHNDDDNHENLCDTVEDLLGTNTNNNTNSHKCNCGCNRYRRR